MQLNAIVFGDANIRLDSRIVKNHEEAIEFAKMFGNISNRLEVAATSKPFLKSGIYYVVSNYFKNDKNDWVQIKADEAVNIVGSR